MDYVEGRGGRKAVLSRQEPGQSCIGEYGVEANVSLACISIRDMAVSNSDSQSRLFRHEVLNSWPGLDDKVEGRTQLSNAGGEVGPEHSGPDIPKGHPPPERQEVILEHQGPACRLRWKRLREVSEDRFRKHLEISGQ